MQYNQIIARENVDVQEQPVQTVLGVLPLVPLLVRYTDGQGKVCVRIVFRENNSKNCFILTKSVANKELVSASNSWFSEGITNKVEGSKLDLESI